MPGFSSSSPSGPRKEPHEDPPVRRHLPLQGDHGLDETRPVRVAAVHVPLERNVNRWEYFVELTNETADWLLQYEKGDWEEVDKEELLTVDELQVESTLAAGASGEGELPSQNPDGAPDASS
jgi:hypothetical protein